MKNMFNNLANRSFSLDLDPPNSRKVEDIRRAVQKFAEHTGDEVVFLDSEAPVAFYLEDVLFSAQICEKKGGPYILCTEQIPQAAR